MTSNGVPTECEKSIEGFENNCAKRMQSLYSQIIAISHYALCSSSMQCRSVAVGTKACGGANQYIAYSTAEADEQKFLALVQEYNRMQVLYQRLEDSISDCSILSDPGARCVEHKCTLNSNFQ